MINPAPFLIRDRGADKGFIYKVTFPIGAVDGFGFTSDFSGTVTSVTAMNSASYTMKKNASPVSFPFSVVKGDIISLESVVKIDSGRISTFIFRAPSFLPQTVNLQAPTEVDATRHHLFVINYTDQTVSVIDTDSDTVVDTLTLPSGYSFTCLCYNSTNDFIYVFGDARVCKINADPASGDFKKIYSNTDVLNGSSSLTYGGAYGPWLDAVYDQVGDQIYLSFSNSNTEFSLIWDLVRVINPLSSYAVQGAYQCALAPPNFRFVIPPLYNGKLESDDQTAWFSSSEQGFAKPCYITSRNSIIVGKSAPREFSMALNPLIEYTTLSTGGASTFSQIYGMHVYAKAYDVLLSIAYTMGDYVAAVDLATNTAIGKFSRSGKAPGETIARSAVYGAKSKKVYIMGSGTSGTVNRVHKLDLALWIAGGKVSLADMEDGYITVGNLIPSTYNVNQKYGNTAMCFNHAIVT